MRQGQTTTSRTMCHTLIDKCVGSLMSPSNHVTLKMLVTEPIVYCLFPRRLEHLTVCRYGFKGSTFFSVILRVLVRFGFQTLNLLHSIIVITSVLMWVLTQCNPSNRALRVTKTVLNLSITVLSNTLYLSREG